MLNCQFFPNSIMKINWSMEGFEIDPWLFDSDPSPFKKQITGGSQFGYQKGKRRLSSTKPQIPVLHSWYPDWLLWWTRAFTPSPSVRVFTLSRNTTFDLASFARKSCLMCIVSFPRVVHAAYFWTRKERSSPLCISLWFSRTCKTGGCDFPALICFNPWWCGAVSRFWGFRNRSRFVEGNFLCNCLRLSKYFYAPRKMSFFWGLVSLGFRV
jgi:hypothetical protein